VLLAKGADINAKENDALLGMTALVAAAGMGHLDVVQALLARGADVNGKIGLDNTALMAAAKNGHLDLVQALLAKGADVSAKTTKGETALTMAQDEKIKAAVLNGGAP
jgi:ankyrin repeat protein